MNRVMIYKLSLFISIALIVIGAVFRIQHWPQGSNLIMIGGAASLAFIFLGAKDVLSNQKESAIVKIMWMVGFIFLSWVTGATYLQQFRKRNG